MLEWIHDPSAVDNLHTDFSSKTLADCLAFIESVQCDSKNLRLALGDDNDTYMRTVSLKHMESRTAELAITVRRAAMAKGYFVSKY